MWEEIRKEYENGGITRRDLADKYSITVGSLKYRIEKEGWKKNKNTLKSTDEPVNQPEQEDNADNFPENQDKRELIVSVADKLLGCVSRAADELDRYVIKNKVKTKMVEYDESSGKAGVETINEDEYISSESSIVDRGELRQLVTALKDIKDIYENVTDSDNRIEELIRGLCDDG